MAEKNSSRGEAWGPAYTTYLPLRKLCRRSHSRTPSYISTLLPRGFRAWPRPGLEGQGEVGNGGRHGPASAPKRKTPCPTAAAGQRFQGRILLGPTSLPQTLRPADSICSTPAAWAVSGDISPGTLSRMGPFSTPTSELAHSK